MTGHLSDVVCFSLIIPSQRPFLILPHLTEARHERRVRGGEYGNIGSPGMRYSEMGRRQWVSITSVLFRGLSCGPTSDHAPAPASLISPSLSPTIHDTYDHHHHQAPGHPWSFERTSLHPDIGRYFIPSFGLGLLLFLFLVNSYQLPSRFPMHFSHS